ncbi:nidogen-like domain-containing protein [uncultured Hymenobacter sp.]|uniref:nidogen-like domain-containing protein n=1 Tax=uncultured Hymenobacter sp. TaxID=170016 RepID=UPI0035CA98A2
MRNLFSLPVVWLLSSLCLAGLVKQEAVAQTTPQVHDPASTDPLYTIRKLRQASLSGVSAAPNQFRSITTSSAAQLPACFEPLDSVSAPSAGGYIPIPRNDDGSFGPVALGFTYTLFGTPYTSVYINTNGNITFNAPLSEYSASGFPISTPMVAGFWADVDTRPANSGRVWYKIYPDRLVVTWNRVGYFANQIDKKNTFQIVLRSNTTVPVADDALFAYGDMQWTTGSASGGVSGFGGTLATVGANRGINNEFIQTGRFNLNDASHPDNVNASGVNWLDDQCISYTLFSSGNLPPSATNLPLNNTITVNQGQTVSIAPQFSGPEAGQAITLAVNTNGLCNALFTISGGINPTLNLSVTGGPCNVGTSTILITATDNGTPVATRQFPITVIVNPPTAVNGQWTGNVSTAYSEPANWSNNVLPTSITNVTIPASAVRMPVLSTAASTNNFTIATGATLTLATNGTLTFTGTLLANGSCTGPGTLVTAGSAQQSVGGGGLISVGELTVGGSGTQLAGPVAVSRMLTLNSTLTTNAQPLTLLSNATGTAMVVNNGAATVVGSATVQRYISPSLNPDNGYRHYSSPVSNTTLADLITLGFTPVVNPAFNTASNPAAVQPYPNIFGFDETRITSAAPSFEQGWFSPTALSSVMLPGLGFTVNIAATATVDFVGTLNNGPISRSGLTYGTQTESGWHLLGNPYPAPIDWSSTGLSLSGLDNAVYVFKSSGPYEGSYSSYVNGVGDARFIAVGQAFFVRASTPGSPGNLTFTNAARLTSYLNPDFNRNQNAKIRPLIQLDLVGGTRRDAAILYFEQGATPNFDRAFDAHKLSNSNGLQIAFVAGAEQLSISGLPTLTRADVAVPLSVRVPTTGTYILEAVQVQNLPAGCYAYLQDAQTGATIDLDQRPAYSFSMDASFSGSRFTLLLSYARILTNASSLLSHQVQLYPNPTHDAATLLLPTAMHKQAVTATLLNQLGQSVRTYTLLAGQGSEQHTLSLSGMAKGIYSLRLTTLSGIATKRLIIE